MGPYAVFALSHPSETMHLSNVFAGDARIILRSGCIDLLDAWVISGRPLPRKPVILFAFSSLGPFTLAMGLRRTRHNSLRGGTARYLRIPISPGCSVAHTLRFHPFDAVSAMR